MAGHIVNAIGLYRDGAFKKDKLKENAVNKCRLFHR